MGFAQYRRVRARPAEVEKLAAGGDVDGLLELAAHADPRVSVAAASHLAEMDPREAAPAVRAALTHGADRIRCAAVGVLYEWGDAMSLAESVFWLPPEAASRGLALAAIAELREPESAPVLAGSLVACTAQEGLWEDEVELVLSLCRSTPGWTTLGRVLDVLAEAFEVRDEVIASRAEDFLIWLGEDAVHTVTALARSSAAPDRAVWILGQIGGAVVMDPLIEAVDHPNAKTREKACVSLGELQDPISVEALIRATYDREQSVRVAAATALDRIGTAAVLARLGVHVPGPHLVSGATRKGADDRQNGTTHSSRSGARVQMQR